jgi:hypothetical protein
VNAATGTLVATPDPVPETVLVHRSPALPADSLRVEVGPDPVGFALFAQALRVTVGAEVARWLGLPAGGWRTTRADLPEWFGRLVDGAEHGQVVTAPKPLPWLMAVPVRQRRPRAPGRRSSQGREGWNR